MIFHTIMEEKIKALFFNETLKRWHFEEIVTETEMSRERVNHFLRELLKENFIKRIKPRGKMPYYTSNLAFPKFRNEKRLYGLSIIEKSGLFEHLSRLKNVKTAILFGSYARGDWSKSSDIDIFIYGDDKDFAEAKFERRLKREIQVFSYKDPKKIKELDPKIIPNIIKGFYLKESLEPFKVDVNA